MRGGSVQWMKNALASGAITPPRENRVPWWYLLLMKAWAIMVTLGVAIIVIALSY